MNAYDLEQLGKLVAHVERTARGRNNNRAKGEAMADLVAHVFERVPGMELRHRSFVAPDKTSEMDLVFHNVPYMSHLFDGVTLLVECKNEARKISTAEVRIFGSKLRDRNQPVGLMVSRTGLSGRPGTKTAAHGVVSFELSAGHSIVVLALADLVRLRNAADLVERCDERRFELEAFGTYNTI
jgi:hypothetical protein